MMVYEIEVKSIHINSSLRAGECHLRVSRLSEGSQSQVQMLFLISIMQSVGGRYLRVPMLTEVDKDNIQRRFRRRDATYYAPKRLNRVKAVESTCATNFFQFLLLSTFTSDVTYYYYYHNDNKMVQVVFLAQHSQTVQRRAEMSPRVSGAFPTSPRMLRCSGGSTRRRRSYVGLDIFRHLPAAKIIIPLCVYMYARIFIYFIISLKK